VDWLIGEFKTDTGLDLHAKGNEMALQRLRDAAEKAKIRAVDGAGERDQPAVYYRGTRAGRSTWCGR